MASYVTVLLDTTAPRLEIFAPRFTNQVIQNEITIEANESIENLEIYVIDTEGTRRDYTFERVSNNLHRGKIRFDGYPLGISTLFARATDDVGNVSDIYSHSFEIKDSVTGLTLKISDRSTKIELREKQRLIQLKERQIKIDTSDKEKRR